MTSAYWLSVNMQSELCFALKNGNISLTVSKVFIPALSNGNRPFGVLNGLLVRFIFKGIPLNLAYAYK